MTSPQLRLAPAPAADARVRVVTAAALFDGHDAAIHIVRRLLQAAGAEVVHLGHDRSVEEIAEAAVQEDADAVAVSSYQGGHMEFFRYLVQRLRELGAGHVRVYGGGGGTIVPEEIAALEAAGVARIFSPDDGRALGLEGMIRTMLDECAAARSESCAGARREAEVESEAGIAAGDPAALSRAISWFERHAADRPAEAEALRRRLAGLRRTPPAPVVGVTGTGGSGKSSVVDELVRRWRRDHPGGRVGLLLVDPTRRRSGGALLGDRIRMNAIHGAGAFARSLATRAAHLALSATVADGLRVLQAGGFDLLVVETAGIGQSDSEVVDLADVPVYVMTPDYGAPSQLEKIDMLDFAELVVLNKSDRRGAEDALRDVRKQWRRNHRDFETPDAALPVLATVARAWDDPGMDRLYEALLARLGQGAGRAPRPVRAAAPLASELVPAARSRYLAEISELVRGYRGRTDTLAERARDAEGCERAARLLPGDAGPARAALAAARASALDDLPEPLRRELGAWPDTAARYRADVQEYGVRERVHRVENHTTSLAGSRIPKVALPRGDDPGALVRFLRQENLPGRFPFTAGVFPFRLESEDPTRMFAGEGGPARTNRRFHLLSEGQKGVRLSTAFDSVTLYGRDPDERPDIFGKVGTSGVSVCSVDDAKILYSGFDLCAPDTSVSMTINGPAPMVLAFFLNAAIDQAVERHLRAEGRLDAVRARFAAEGPLPVYDGELPAGHDGVGLGLLGIRGDRAVDAETYARIRADVLARVRGTVQADILKEDQAQNTCIFSTEFALQLMGDVQAWFVEQGVRNFYSVSVSGYHIAEAGANPISQLAFTLANGFTYCEYYLARGMAIDAFAPSFSFFFSNGLDPEYAVIGRVARRIWAIAMRERYGASERSQKLKYHVQTSGRSLHAREMAFNDIRTTLQALLAIQDRCNSLHTNAYDEAVTTPTPESVRRALAIQLIIQRELGTTRNENPLQGSYLIDELTDLVEEAVLAELERISARGGVLGAMETLYQRGRIQEESLLYESKKHSGELPIVGVNTFEGPEAADALRPTALMRASDAEKRAQLAGVHAFQARHAAEFAPAVARLQEVARRGENVFAELMDTVKVASLGQITDALFEVGGRYRRAM